MDYRQELEYLKRGNTTNGNLHVDIYENKAELLERLSENADDPQGTYDYAKEKLNYLDDEKDLYSVDIGNGETQYFDDAKEAYEYV